MLLLLPDFLFVDLCAADVITVLNKFKREIGRLVLLLEHLDFLEFLSACKQLFFLLSKVMQEQHGKVIKYYEENNSSLKFDLQAIADDVFQRYH